MKTSRLTQLAAKGNWVVTFQDGFEHVIEPGIASLNPCKVFTEEMSQGDFWRFLAEDDDAILERYRVDPNDPWYVLVPKADVKSVTFRPYQEQASS